jgi:hypothetical protein
MRILIPGLRLQQAVGNPHQAQPSERHEAGNLQQPHDSDCHHRSHHDGTDSTPHDRLFLQRGRQVARRQGNDNCVVASQDEVDKNDGQQR